MPILSRHLLIGFPYCNFDVQFNTYHFIRFRPDQGDLDEEGEQGLSTNLIDRTKHDTSPIPPPGSMVNRKKSEESTNSIVNQRMKAKTTFKTTQLTKVAREAAVIESEEEA